MGNALKAEALSLYSLNASRKAKVFTRQQETAQYEVITSEGEKFKAVKALSCLIQPEAGDVVLLHWVEDECWITAILTRQRDAIEIELSPGVTIAAGDGNLLLNTAANCTLQARQHLIAKSACLISNSEDCRLTSDSISISSTAFVAVLKRTRFFFDHADIVGKKLLQRLADSLKIVTGNEHIESETTVYNVKKTFSCFSARTFLKSKKEVRVDADEIHMG